MSSQIKCIVWDLDETLWRGTLLEGDKPILRPKINSVLQELENRGILNSIASRNEGGTTLSTLQQLNIDHYFVAPQINFNPKPDNLALIAKELNIDISSLAFIDDSPFERQGVRYAFPEVLVLEAEAYLNILDMPEFNPKLQTIESRQRTAFYQKDEERKQAGKKFKGTRLEFLKSCKIELTLRPAQSFDIPRIVELSERTNQFNSTGLDYSTEQINAIIERPDVYLVVAEMKDKFGTYGNIGVMILKIEKQICIVENLMISCRSAGRGVSAAMMILAIQIAKSRSADFLLTNYHENERNRQLGIFYAMMGFTVDSEARLVYDLSQQGIPENPEWIDLNLLVDVRGA
jgi:FkbH-like protein